MYGPGLFHEAERARLSTEGDALVAEGLDGSLRVHVRRAPGVRHRVTLQGATGAVAVTSRRLVIFVNGSTRIDVTHRDPVRRRIDVRLAGADRVEFSCALDVLRPGSEGTVRLRLRTTHAPELVRRLNGSG